jgi:hypothetical protein
MDLVVARIAIGHGEYLQIFFVAVHHVQHAHGTHLDHDSGIAGLLHENQHVEWIVVVGQRARDETVVAGIMQGRVERAIQPEDAQVPVVFVLFAECWGISTIMRTISGESGPGSIS